MLREGKMEGDGRVKDAIDLLARLKESWAVERLVGIDLSVVPSWMVEDLAVASRFEHSTHVADLALVVSKKLNIDPVLLSASGLLHDVGCGPFPHISDELMRILIGWEHPSNVGFVLERSPDDEIQCLEQYGLEANEVFQIIAGKHKYSPLINGEIDLDNADNIYRYIATMPSLPLGRPTYKPLEIALSMKFESGRLWIEKEVRERWMNDRQRIYSYLENHEGNITAWVMLSRAMRLLIEEIDENFFLLSNRDAFSLLKSKLPTLIEDLLEKKFLLLENVDMYELNSEMNSIVREDRADWKRLIELEEKICSELGVEKWSFGIEILLSKGFPSWGSKTLWKAYLVSRRDDKKLRKAWKRYLGIL